MSVVLRALLCLIALAIADDACAQGSRKTPGQNPQGSQQQPDNEKRGTDQSPFIIKILPAEHAQEKTEADRSKGPEKWFDGWTLSDRIAAIASTVAFLQFAALVWTIFVMMGTSKRQLRAYVLILPAERIDHLDNPDIPVARFEIRNFGTTPAYDLTGWQGMIIREHPLQSDLPRAAEELFRNSKIDLAPTAAYEQIGSLERPMTDTEVVQIRVGTKAIYVWGEIEYKDAFGKPRFTKYRMICSQSGFARRKFNYDHDGNNAT